MTRSSILYQNSQNTVFLLDIPTSIALAQDLSPLQQKTLSYSSEPEPDKTLSITNKNVQIRQILSSIPPKDPYSGSTEPKTDVARAKVLHRIPVSERDFHNALSPLVRNALHEIREGLQGDDEWCFARRALVHDYRRDSDIRRAAGGISLGKRSRRSKAEDDDCQFPVDVHMDSITSGKSPESEDSLSSPELSNPPVILSSGLNLFDSMSSLCNLVTRNPAAGQSTVKTRCVLERPDNLTDSEWAGHHHHTYYIPPLSSFLLCKLPIAQSSMKPNSSTDQIPGLPRDRKFDLILFDPPWLNRSVRRSRHYHTQNYLEGDILTQRIRDILRVHLQDNHRISPTDNSDDYIVSVQNPIGEENQRSIAAIWITNSAKARKTAYDAIQGAGLSVCEEWVWIKTTTNGDPITPLHGLWRKPYEILVIGMKQCPQQPTGPLGVKGNGAVTRRFIAAVPDVHSRKPSLREVFEEIFFANASLGKSGDSTTYSALEVFARNLTAGWWACGDEALKFNAEEWWVDGDVP